MNAATAGGVPDAPETSPAEPDVRIVTHDDVVAIGRLFFAILVDHPDVAHGVSTDTNLRFIRSAVGTGKTRAMIGLRAAAVDADMVTCVLGDG